MSYANFPFEFHLTDVDIKALQFIFGAPKIM